MDEMKQEKIWELHRCEVAMHVLVQLGVLSQLEYTLIHGRIANAIIALEETDG